MDAAERTVLSAGLVVNALLRQSQRIQDLFGGAPRIYPVVSMTEDNFPCIAYARTSLVTEGVKTGRPADTAEVSVQVYSRSYAEAVVMAEAVRAALEGAEWDDGELRLRGCWLADATEDAMANGVYLEELIFEVKL